MLMDLPISERKYLQVKEVEDKKRDHVYFQLIDGKCDDCLFIFCHGNIDGNIIINKHVFTMENVLDAFLTKPEFKQKGFKHIIMICCHGGLNKPITKQGITIKSIHDSVEKIYCRGNCTLDDEYFLSIII